MRDVSQQTDPIQDADFPVYQFRHLTTERKYDAITPPVRGIFGNLKFDYHQMLKVTFMGPLEPADVGSMVGAMAVGIRPVTSLGTATFYIDAGNHLSGDNTGNQGGIDNVFFDWPIAVPHHTITEVPQLPTGESNYFGMPDWLVYPGAGPMVDMDGMNAATVIGIPGTTP